MKIELIKSLSLVAALSLGTAAIAQDNSDASTEDTPAAQPSVDLGEPVDATRQPGQTYVEKVTGDWERKCITMPEGRGDDPCQMYQLLKDETGNPVAEISLGKLPEGNQVAAGATVVVPLETLLTQQLTIAVDGTQGRRYPFRFCTQLGCVANIGFTTEEISGFKKGAKATLTITPAAAPDQRVNLNMSLTGFTAAYDELIVPALAPAAQ
ncbi:Invasion protein IalB, involved in pathogenesis [Aliiroseovarius halocynthiae]|uniref:Invasion associated locus B family protein n=1 Tax=Aliiroseovarius halocynthiae TaxID=985055 RepID=A0A545SWD0_9RHOB|nr:invasion associated locus B family protein [Aliiroseovarius halocynthiae]TQV69271.1 invasion associated locus B family protein [Aliiroseovarius halocynthiae]SMR72044.1 Invasion protein IalB, involved in pathogenesis [Aliiroseovarius halocynthiae]